jgi:U5 small nuclear ribonucleoprotein component
MTGSRFADRLWGDIYYDKSSRKFSRKAQDPSDPRTFVTFVLEPLYKLYAAVSAICLVYAELLMSYYAQVLAKDTAALKVTLDKLQIKLKPVMYKMDVRPLLKAVLDQFFGNSTGLVDMIVEKVPSPVDATADKVCTYDS